MSVGIVQEQSITFANGIKLDSGRILAPITLVYELYGTLNSDASNAILVEHAWTGSAHLAGKLSEKDPKPGWWDAIAGPDRPFASIHTPHSLPATPLVLVVHCKPQSDQAVQARSCESTRSGD